MRIWSFHPKYLDAQGLVALWRESLLAKQVQEGKIKGYNNRPLLIRFKNPGNAVGFINQYLTGKVSTLLLPFRHKSTTEAGVKYLLFCSVCKVLSDRPNVARPSGFYTRLQETDFHW